jgi:hypothetical protein
MLPRQRALPQNSRIVLVQHPSHCVAPADQSAEVVLDLCLWQRWEQLMGPLCKAASDALPWHNPDRGGGPFLSLMPGLPGSTRPCTHTCGTQHTGSRTCCLHLSDVSQSYGVTRRSSALRPPRGSMSGWGWVRLEPVPHLEGGRSDREWVWWVNARPPGINAMPGGLRSPPAIGSGGVSTASLRRKGSASAAGMASFTTPRTAGCRCCASRC